MHPTCRGRCKLTACPISTRGTPCVQDLPRKLLRCQGALPATAPLHSEADPLTNSDSTDKSSTFRIGVMEFYDMYSLCVWGFFFLHLILKAHLVKLSKRVSFK